MNSLQFYRMNVPDHCVFWHKQASTHSGFLHIPLVWYAVHYVKMATKKQSIIMFWADFKIHSTSEWNNKEENKL